MQKEFIITQKDQQGSSKTPKILGKHVEDNHTGWDRQQNDQIQTENKTPNLKVN